MRGHGSTGVFRAEGRSLAPDYHVERPGPRGGGLRLRPHTPAEWSLPLGFHEPNPDQINATVRWMTQNADIAPIP